MRNVYLIGERAGLLERIDTLFNPHFWNVTYIGGPSSRFRNFNNFILIDGLKHRSFIENLLLNSTLLESIDGLIIFGSDSEMAEVVNSDCTIQRKVKLLPAKESIGFQIMDSKVGFSEIVNKFGVQSPRQFVAHNQMDVASLLSEFSSPVLLKGDSGGGGAFIEEISQMEDIAGLKVSHIHFPCVVQEKIMGEQIALEAFFWEGELTGYIYSREVEDIRLFGPSFRRVISQPASLDFIDSLRTLGKALQMHGLVNCTFILEEGSQQHFLVEFDVRPNIWHHLAPTVGMNAEKLFSAPVNNQLETPSTSIRVFSFVRFAQFGSAELNFKIWLGIFRAITDRSMFCIEVGSQERLPKFEFAVRRIGRFLAFAILVQAFRKLPVWAQEPFKKRRITTRISSWILGN